MKIIKVKVAKPRNSGAWYADKIGEAFLVDIDNKHTSGGRTYFRCVDDVGQYNSNVIDQECCEVVPEILTKEEAELKLKIVMAEAAQIENYIKDFDVIKPEHIKAYAIFMDSFGKEFVLLPVYTAYESEYVLAGRWGDMSSAFSDAPRKVEQLCNDFNRNKTKRTNKMLIATEV